jgi:outer membrane protein
MARRIYLTLVCLGLCARAAFCQEQCTPKRIELSLGTAISLSFRNNKDIQIEEQEVGIAKAQIVGARSNFLPKVNVQSSYTRNDAILNLGSANTKKDPGVIGGYKNDNQLGLAIDDSVYNGGADIANFKQARIGLDVSEETLRAKKLDIEFETKRLYYGLLLAYETERIAKDLIGQARSHYEDVKSQFKRGTSSRFDFLQSKVQISKLMPELVKAGNDIDLIMVELKKLLGLKMSDIVTVKDTLAYTLLEIKEGEFLKQAYLNKPEMILDSLGVDINRWSIEMAKAGWRPQVDASGGYNYRSHNLANMFNKKHSNWHVGFSVTVPVFDSWSTRAKVDEAKARYTQALLRKEDMADQIAVDVRSACLDLKEALTIIDSQKDNIVEAKDALAISIVSYDSGVGTNLDVLDSQVSLAQVEQNLSQAIYDYLMAEAFLDRNMGKSFISEVKNEKKT